MPETTFVIHTFYLPTDDLGDIETHEFVSRGVRLEKI